MATDALTELADILRAPPSKPDSAYSQKCIRVATFLGVPPAEKASTAQTTPINSGLYGTEQITGYTQPSADEQLRSRGLRARTNVLAFAESVVLFAAQAKMAGHMPPNNPFVEIARLDTTKRKNEQLDLTATQREALLYNIHVYKDLLRGWQAGTIKFQKTAFGAATTQLLHMTLTLIGIGGSGNTAADLMKFLPTMDEIKAERAKQLLAALDFTKRNPKILFTMDYRPVAGEASHGTIIVWRRITDASGYILRRRDVFGNSSMEIELENDQARENTQAILDYVRTYGLTFLDDIQESSIVAYLDKNVRDGAYYLYHLQAYQLRNESPGAIFTVEYTPANLSSAARLAIIERMRQLDPTDYAAEAGYNEVISPWPVFAQQMMGDANYDWLLAAVNVRASKNRGDSRDVSRQYSYLNARTNFLLEQSAAGKLVKPADISAVIGKISDAVQKFGIGQVIQELLSETGALYHVTGKDVYEDSGFDRAGTLEEDKTDLFAMVSAAIDPDTATLDLAALATNLSVLLSGGALDASTTLSTGESHGESAPQEIDVVDPNGSSNAGDSRLQFVAELGNISGQIADLTTFEGLSKFMRVLRILSDFGPDRVQPKPPPQAPAAVTAPLRTLEQTAEAMETRREFRGGRFIP